MTLAARDRVTSALVALGEKSNNRWKQGPASQEELADLSRETFESDGGGRVAWLAKDWERAFDASGALIAPLTLRWYASEYAGGPGPLQVAFAAQGLSPEVDPKSGTCTLTPEGLSRATDLVRVTEALALLRARGFVAEGSYALTATFGWENARDASEDDEPRAVFWTHQAHEGAVDAIGNLRRPLQLQWSGNPEEIAAVFARVGTSIVVPKGEKQTFTLKPGAVPPSLPAVHALMELVFDLRLHGRPSATWLALFAADGDLSAAIARAWAACGDARKLLFLAQHFTDEPTRIRAACACARDALPYAQALDPFWPELLARLEAWTEGRGDEAALQEAVDALWNDRSVYDAGESPVATAASLAIEWAAAVAMDPGISSGVTEVPYFAAWALHHARRGKVPEQVPDELACFEDPTPIAPALAALVPAVCKVISPPTLEQLATAAREWNW
jgi:hypothetical protein